MNRSLPKVLLLALLAAAPASAGAPTSATLDVDLTQAWRGIFHAVETMPAAPGELTLALPRWIPGEHGPTGPIDDLAGLVFEAADAAGTARTVPWTRDPLDLFAFHLTLPSATTSLTARFDYLGAGSSGEYIDGPCSTANLAILSWNHVVLAPSGVSQREFTITPTVRLPAGWNYGTSLAPGSVGPTSVTFAPVTLEFLVDSPLSCGRFTREIPLAPELPQRHRAFLVADSERALAAPADLVHQWEQVVRETRKALGGPHYRSYTFLLTLSDNIASFGLEHHESSDNRMSERALIEPGGRTANALLLSHEFVHSWNGKYRRPADMDPVEFSTPLKTDLLWVYEGLTEYYGWVLGARAGTVDAAGARDDLALNAATLDARAGRRWRPLVDTATSASLLNTAPGAWSTWRRGQDYYDESALIWLEADMKIRALTNGRRSLDDFCRAFFGGAAGPPAVVPYRRVDLLDALGGVAPFDWDRFLADRVDSVRAHAPMGGIEAAGWQLAFRDSAGEYLEALNAEAERTDYRFSLGFRVVKEGTLPDILPDSPAARAGLAPGMKLVAVNGRMWSKSVLDDALDGTKPAERDPGKALAAGPRGRNAIELLAASGEFYRTYRVEYAGGPRFPYLKRRAGAADGIARITAPRAARARP